MIVKKKKGRLAVRRSKNGLGLFTCAEISRDDFIIEYTGKRISSDEADRNGGKYLFEINSKWVIDAKARKNLASYINHSCYPNCEVINEGGELNVYAKCAIKAGEELHYHYGKGYFEDHIKPVGCKCSYCLNKRKKQKRK